MNTEQTLKCYEETLCYSAVYIALYMHTPTYKKLLFNELVYKEEESRILEIRFSG